MTLKINEAIETQKMALAAASGTGKAKAEAVLQYYAGVKAVASKPADADQPVDIQRVIVKTVNVHPSGFTTIRTETMTT